MYENGGHELDVQNLRYLKILDSNVTIVYWTQNWSN